MFHTLRPASLFQAEICRHSPRSSFRTALATGAAAVGLCAALAGRAEAASVVEPLYYFSGAPDGASPDGGVLRTPTGILYGSTFYGGPYADPATGAPFNYGLIYQLVPPAPQRPGSTESVLYAFQGGADGFYPSGELTQDLAGNLYGTTVRGGPAPSSPGTVFELSPPFGGQTGWVKTVLHTFGVTADDVGQFPTGSLVQDAAGALYGATLTNIFKLTPPALGQSAWTYTTLFETAPGTTGSSSLLGALAIDATGALYATSSAGGTHSCGTAAAGAPAPSCGTVFKLTPPAAGGATWSAKILHDFTGGADGGLPSGRLSADALGNFYGTTEGYTDASGAPVAATVFRLSPPAAGQTAWTNATLWTYPAGLGIGSSGVTLYGGAIYGAATAADGPSTTLFKLTPTGTPGAAWTETILAQSPGNVAMADLTADAPDQLLFGTMQKGPKGGGSVFSLSVAP